MRRENGDGRQGEGGQETGEGRMEEGGGRMEDGRGRREKINFDKIYPEKYKFCKFVAV